LKFRNTTVSSSNFSVFPFQTSQFFPKKTTGEKIFNPRLQSWEIRQQTVT